MLRALCEYYDCLCRQKDSGFIPDGYEREKISLNLVLKSDGKIKEILPYTRTVNNGKKVREVEREELFPFRYHKSTILSETIEAREKYLFGLEWDKTAEKLTTTKNSLLAFSKCKEKNLEFLEGLHSQVIDAFRNFLLSWNPEKELENAHLVSLGRKYSGAKFVITHENDTGFTHTLNRDPLVKEKWERLWSNKPVPEDAVMGQCSVSGEYGPIARIHNKLSAPGIPGGLDTGVNIVCLKNSAFWSYGKKKSYNSSVSQKSMEKYTKAFNYLAASEIHRLVLDDMLLLFWTMTEKSEKPYMQAFTKAIGFLNFSANNAGEAEKREREIQDNELAAIFRQLAEGKEADWQGFGIDKNVEFYILGLKANSSRLAIKIFEHNTFGNIMRNVHNHHQDISFSPDDRQITILQICKELKSPKSTRAKKSAHDTISSDLTAKILQSILTGSPYPRYLLDTVIRRVKTDKDKVDDKNKFYAVNRNRVRIIKACLTRFKYIERGEINMLKTDDVAFNCGRLFAVLEKLQIKALTKDNSESINVKDNHKSINATIKDRFFSSACSTPYLVFPRLLKLAQSHLGKLDTGSQIYFEKLIQDILSNLNDSFPKAMNMEKQGMFILGYYQQKESLYENRKGE